MGFQSSPSWAFCPVCLRCVVRFSALFLLCVRLVGVSPGTQNSAEVAVLARPLGGAAHDQVTEDHPYPLLIV